MFSDACQYRQINSVSLQGAAREATQNFKILNNLNFLKLFGSLLSLFLFSIQQLWKVIFGKILDGKVGGGWVVGVWLVGV